MNVFDLAAQYVDLDRLVDDEGNAIPDDVLLDKWLEVEGDLNTKIENIGWALKNREAALAGSLLAAKNLDDRINATEKEIDRLKNLLLMIMERTDKKKVVGTYLSIGWQFNAPSVRITDESKITGRFKRWTAPVKPDLVLDNKALLVALNDGEVIDGAERYQTKRVVIK